MSTVNEIKTVRHTNMPGQTVVLRCTNFPSRGLPHLSSQNIKTAVKCKKKHGENDVIENKPCTGGHIVVMVTVFFV